VTLLLNQVENHFPPPREWVSYTDSFPFLFVLDFLALFVRLVSRSITSSKTPACFHDDKSAVNWRRRRPDELIQVIQSCIFLDMVHWARELADEGRRLFPNDNMKNTLLILLNIHPPISR
jgi:hypothetical protein